MITIQIDNRAVLDALAAFQAKTADLTPAMQDIGEYLLKVTRERFQTSTGPDGEIWDKNAEVTLSHKKGTKPLIGESRSLSTQIYYQVGRNQVMVGSPLIYSAVQQFGAHKGQFGATRRGSPIPWGDIPARPYLGISVDDEREILDIVSDYLLPDA